MNEVLAIIGKRPIKGFSKTRLAKDIGEDKALQLYQCFIQDFFQSIPSKYKVYLFGTPKDDQTKEYFSQFTNSNFYFQDELPFFQRLSQIFKTIESIEGRECFIHLTGTDIPDFPFDRLDKIVDKERIYLGPDRDGGYYYLGAKSYYNDVFDIDANAGKSTVLHETLKLCGEKGYKTYLLDTWSDIDTLEDLRNSSLYEKYEKLL